MPVGSESYSVVRRWLDRGTPGIDAKRLSVTALKLATSELLLNREQRSSQPVQAVWSDGVVQDVTTWALFDSQDNEVAEVSSDGNIVATGPGRAAVTVRFLGQVASISVTVPFGSVADFKTFTPCNFIGEHILAEWSKVGLNPTEASDDAAGRSGRERASARESHRRT